MPRTIEHIVDCHVAATKLRKAGKPIWNKEIPVKAILQEDPKNETIEHIASVSVRIGKLLKSTVPPYFLDEKSELFNGDLNDLIVEFSECTVASLRVYEENGIEAIDQLNELLDELYYWADSNRIWLG
jgi:hypothetical protein